MCIQKRGWFERVIAAVEGSTIGADAALRMIKEMDEAIQKALGFEQEMAEMVVQQLRREEK